MTGGGAEGYLPPTAELFVTDRWRDWKNHFYPMHTHKLHDQALIDSSNSVLSQMALATPNGSQNKTKSHKSGQKYW